MLRRFFYILRYLKGDAPWDTGITPPEIVSLIEGEALSPGRAIDLGCGTGLNSVYLARHGWDVVGIDFVAQPIRKARRRSKQAGTADRTKFIVGDIQTLDSIPAVHGPFDLALDIGCSHGLPRKALLKYVSDLARLIQPGGTLMLYMFRPTPARPIGLNPEEVEDLFLPAFTLQWSNAGVDQSAGTGSAWYRLFRLENQ